MVLSNKPVPTIHKSTRCKSWIVPIEKFHEFFIREKNLRVHKKMVMIHNKYQKLAQKELLGSENIIISTFVDFWRILLVPQAGISEIELNC